MKLYRYAENGDEKLLVGEYATADDAIDVIHRLSDPPPSAIAIVAAHDDGSLGKTLWLLEIV